MRSQILTLCPNCRRPGCGLRGRTSRRRWPPVVGQRADAGARGEGPRGGRLMSPNCRRPRGGHRGKATRSLRRRIMAGKGVVRAGVVANSQRRSVSFALPVMSQRRNRGRKGKATAITSAGVAFSVGVDCCRGEGPKAWWRVRAGAGEELRSHEVFGLSSVDSSNWTVGAGGRGRGVWTSWAGAGWGTRQGTGGGFLLEGGPDSGF